MFGRGGRFEVLLRGPSSDRRCTGSGPTPRRRKNPVVFRCCHRLALPQLFQDALTPPSTRYSTVSRYIKIGDRWCSTCECVGLREQEGFIKRTAIGLEENCGRRASSSLLAQDVDLPLFVSRFNAQQACQQGCCRGGAKASPAILLNQTPALENHRARTQLSENLNPMIHHDKTKVQGRPPFQ